MSSRREHERDVEGTELLREPYRARKRGRQSHAGSPLAASAALSSTDTAVFDGLSSVNDACREGFRLTLCDQGEGRANVVVFGEDGVRFGRDRSCSDVVLHSSSISRLHCVLSVMSDEVYVHDKSSNGTFINGSRVGRGRRSLLQPGDVLCFVNPVLTEAGQFAYVFTPPPELTDEANPLVHPSSSFALARSEDMRRYNLGPVIGQGSFAVVRLGVNKDTQEEVAVKIVEKEQLSSELGLTSLRAEMEIMHRMQHPHIVRVLEIIDTPETVALVMEYVPGGDLFDYIVGRGRSPFTEEEARFLFVQLLEAIVYVHNRKVVHCDIKPENVLVDVGGSSRTRTPPTTTSATPAEYLATDEEMPSFPTGATESTAHCPDVLLLSVADNHQVAAKDISPFEVCLKLTDFGVAKYRGEKSEEEDPVGSAAYAAPEVLRSAGGSSGHDPHPEVDHDSVFTSAVDVWSLGVLLYVMCSGALPKRAQYSEVVQFNKHMNHISDSCKDLIQSMMILDPAKRIRLASICHHPWLDGESVLGESNCFEEDLLSATATLSPRFGRPSRFNFANGDQDSVRPSTSEVFESPGKLQRTERAGSCEDV